MSRHSDYAGIDVDTPAAAVRARGIDPETFSLACLAGYHSECPGVLDSPRNRGYSAAPCQCDAPGCTHGRPPRRRHTPNAPVKAGKVTFERYPRGDRPAPPRTR